MINARRVEPGGCTKYLCDDLLKCDILECDPHGDPHGISNKQLDEDYPGAFPSKDLCIGFGSSSKELNCPGRDQVEADQIKSELLVLGSKPTKQKARRQSYPIPVDTESKSLGMDYELTNWDILCGRGRGESSLPGRVPVTINCANP